MIERDPDADVEYRTKQIAYLARYGRQSMLQWDEVPVARVDALFEALSDIVKGEHAPTRAMTEDH